MFFKKRLSVPETDDMYRDFYKKLCTLKPGDSVEWNGVTLLARDSGYRCECHRCKLSDAPLHRCIFMTTNFPLPCVRNPVYLIDPVDVLGED